MSSDPLYQPLGKATGVSGRPRGIGLRVGAFLLALMAVAGAALQLWHDGRKPDRGIAVAAIEVAPPAPSASPPAISTPAVHALADEAERPSGDTVEVQNGVKIIRLGAASSSKSVAIPVPRGGEAKLAATPDPRLLEPSRFGDLPRIGATGARPSEVYARPATIVSGGAVVGLLVADMGADQMGTAEAARTLPPAVTFAFGPGNADLAAQTAETRRAGHEVVLELAGEPAIGGAGRSLQPGSAAGDGLDRLHWMMGRFTGYAGVALVGQPSLPAGPVASDAVLRDVARRGLYLAADAAVAHDAPQPTPGGAGLQLAAVTMTIDATQDHAMVTAALARLADLAATNGSALGILHWRTGAMPDVQSFADGLARRGVTLVPVSALAAPRPGLATAAATR